jgi:hypothetical protein
MDRPSGEPTNETPSDRLMIDGPLARLLLETIVAVCLTGIVCWCEEAWRTLKGR